MNSNEAAESGTPADPATAPTSQVADAVKEAINETQEAAAPQVQPEPTFHVSGAAFFNVCQYVGSRPLKEVINLRKGLWQIQQEQKCLVPNQLPEKVWLTQSAVNILIEFLSSCPCDAVYETLAAFEKDLQVFVENVQREAKEAAAAKALTDAQTTLAALPVLEVAEPSTPSDRDPPVSEAVVPATVAPVAEASAASPPAPAPTPSPEVVASEAAIEPPPAPPPEAAASTP